MGRNGRWDSFFRRNLLLPVSSVLSGLGDGSTAGPGLADLTGSYGGDGLDYIKPGGEETAALLIKDKQPG